MTPSSTVDSAQGYRGYATPVGYNTAQYAASVRAASSAQVWENEKEYAMMAPASSFVRSSYGFDCRGADLHLSASRRRARVTAIGRTAPCRSAQGWSYIQFERQRAITAIAESRFSWRAASAALASAAQASFANAIHESKPRASNACIMRESARRINSHNEWRVSNIKTHASYARALAMFAQRSRKRSITRRRLFFVLFSSRAISRKETTA